MKTLLKTYFTLIGLLLFTTLQAQGIRVRFEVGQMSVNVAEGTTGLSPFFSVIPDTLNLEENDINPIDLT